MPRRGILRVAVLVSRQHVDHPRSPAPTSSVSAIANRHVETIVGFAGLDLAQGQLGPWLGTTPDGWPVTTLDAGTHDIYALDWEAP